MQGCAEELSKASAIWKYRQYIPHGAEIPRPLYSCLLSQAASIRADLRGGASLAEADPEVGVSRRPPSGQRISVTSCLPSQLPLTTFVPTQGTAHCSLPCTPCAPGGFKCFHAQLSPLHHTHCSSLPTASFRLPACTRITPVCSWERLSRAAIMLIRNLLWKDVGKTPRT